MCCESIHYGILSFNVCVCVCVCALTDQETHVHEAQVEYTGQQE